MQKASRVNPRDWEFRELPLPASTRFIPMDAHKLTTPHFEGEFRGA